MNTKKATAITKQQYGASLTRAQYEDLMKKLGEKYPIEGCQAFSSDCGKKDDNGRFICQYCRKWNGQEREGISPVLLGGVLEKINKLCGNETVEVITKAVDRKTVKIKTLLTEYYAKDVFYYWRECGLDKSIQTIVEESGWESVVCSCDNCTRGIDCGEFMYNLKSPDANELLSYLYNLFCNNQER